MRTAAVALTLLLSATIVRAGVPLPVENYGPSGCPPGPCASGFAWDNYVAINSITTLGYPSAAVGPSVDIVLRHDPALDSDADHSGDGNPDLPHEFRFDIVGGSHNDPDKDMCKVTGWILLVDWDLDGVEANGCGTCGSCGSADLVSQQCNGTYNTGPPGSSTPGDNFIFHRDWNNTTKEFYTNDASSGQGLTNTSLILSKAIPSNPSTHASGVYPFKVKIFYQNCNAASGGTLEFNGYLSLPTLSTWSYHFGKNWILNWERHLTFDDVDLNADGNVTEDLVQWIDATGFPRVFPRPSCSGSPEHVTPSRVGTKNYSLKCVASKTLCGSTLSNLYAITTAGPGIVEYYYDDTHGSLAGRLAAVTDPFGNTVCLAYDASNRIDYIKDQPGSKWVVRYADSVTTHVDYYPPGATAALYTATFHRDSNGRLDYWIAPEHQGLSGNPHTQDFTYGATNSFQRNRILTKTGLDRPRVDYEYVTTAGLTQGYLAKHWLNNDTSLRTEYAYDWAQTSGLPSECKSQKRVTISSPEDILAGRSGTKYYLTGKGWIWKEESPGDSSTKMVTEYHYFWQRGNPYNFSLAQKVYRNGNGDILPSTGAKPTRYVPFTSGSGAEQSSGALWKVIDSANRETVFNYGTQSGIPTGCSSGSTDDQALLGSVTDPGGNVKKYYYKAKGLSGFTGYVPCATKDEAGKTTTYTYDDNGRITEVAPPGLGKTTYEYYTETSYDSSSGAFPMALKKTKDGEASASTPNGGNTTKLTYDGAGRVAGTRTQNTSGVSVRGNDYEYNAAGWLGKVKERDLVLPTSEIVTEYYYDNAGRLTTTQENNNSNRGAAYTYNTLGQLTAEKRCDNGGSTCKTFATYTYDKDGRVASATDNASITLYSTYDARGRLTRVQNGTGADCTASNDPCWRESRSYTTESRLSHLAWVYKIGSDVDNTNDIYYTFDYEMSRYSGGSTGKVVAVTTKVEGDTSKPWRTVEYEYPTATNVVDRLAQKRIWKDDDYLFSSDEDPNDTVPPVAEDLDIDYLYDVTGRVSRITALFKAGTTENVSFEYKDWGGLYRVCEGTSCPGSTWTTTYDYWSNGWVKDIDHRHPGIYSTTPVARFQYNNSSYVNQGYDYDGNRVAVDETRNTTTYNHTYSYDDFNRLTQATLPSDTSISPLSYAYDAVGNLTSISRDTDGTPATTSFTYSPAYLNELSTLSGATTRYYCSDAMGNITYAGTGSITCPPSASQQMYFWDYANRVAKDNVTGGGLPRNRYKYNPRGFRIFEKRENTLGNTTFQYLLDGEHILGVYDDTGALVEYALYAPGADALISKWKAAGSGTRYDYLRDGVNSVATVLTGSTIHKTYRYEPFGLKTPSSNSFFDRFAFTGREASDLSGQVRYFYRARWYDPEIGRFLSRDEFPGTKRLPQSMNRYSYVRGNPVRYSDPYGLCPTDCSEKDKCIACLESRRNRQCEVGAYLLCSGGKASGCQQWPKGPCTDPGEASGPPTPPDYCCEVHTHPVKDGLRPSTSDMAQGSAPCLITVTGGRYYEWRSPDGPPPNNPPGKPVPDCGGSPCK